MPDLCYLIALPVNQFVISVLHVRPSFVLFVHVSLKLLVVIGIVFLVIHVHDRAQARTLFVGLLMLMVSLCYMLLRCIGSFNHISTIVFQVAAAKFASGFIKSSSSSLLVHA